MSITRSNLLFNNDNQSQSTGLRNTETVHIYAIATFVDAIQALTDNDDQQQRRKNIKSASISFLLAIIQVMILGGVVYETSIPTGSSHACKSVHAGFIESIIESAS